VHEDHRHREPWDQAGLRRLLCRCQQYGIRDLLAIFDRKYAKTGYNRTHVLKSLTYFADAEKDPMPHMLAPLDWKEVKLYFEREAPLLR
jgi:hypothetical protein